MSYQHLKERSYYEELYDRFTVEDCRWYEEPRPVSEAEQEAKKNLTPKQIQWGHDFATDLLLFKRTGDRYLRREETINEWTERDRRRDEKVEKARKPMVRCPSCGSLMNCHLTHLHTNQKPEEERVEYFFSCKPCKQSKRLLEDGTEIASKPVLCKKCNGAVEVGVREREGRRYLIDTCKSCGNVAEVICLDDEEKKGPSQEEIDRFEYDKKRFCLTSAQGDRYKHWVEGMKRLEGVRKEQEVNVEYFDKLAELKKLTIAQLEKKLKSAVTKQGFDDMRITLPQTEREIVVHFSVRDTKDDREDYVSRKALEKTIEGVLSDTNWSLLSGVVDYRLGLLSGRIRGYETEEELQQLTKARMKKRGMIVIKS